jgi:transcriptional regulator with XRE-family HTH domain
VNHTAFKENLQGARRAKYLTKAELARLAGLHEATIGRLEAGTQFPSMQTVRQLAEALQVEPGLLLSQDEVAEREKATAQVA